MAAISALEEAARHGPKANGNKHRVDLHTDSSYLRLGITLWIKKWQLNGWLTAEGEPVKNQDLWMKLNKVWLDNHIVKWHWVKGHAGNKWNERADDLAVEARNNQVTLHEIVSPVTPGTIEIYLGASCAPKDGPNPDRAVGPGAWSAILTFGEHVKEIGGYEENTTANRMHIVAALEALKAIKQSKPIIIYSVSQWLDKGATEWVYKWRAQGKLAEGKQSHSDAWIELIDLMEGHDIKWTHTKRSQAPAYIEQAKQVADKYRRTPT